MRITAVVRTARGAILSHWPTSELAFISAGVTYYLGETAEPTLYVQERNAGRIGCVLGTVTNDEPAFSAVNIEPEWSFEDDDDE